MGNASDMKKGTIFKHQNNIWRTTNKEVTAVGTHSHTKVKIFARPLTGGGEKSFIFAHQDKVDILDIIRKQAQVISKTDSTVQIMDNVSYETFDAKCNEELLTNINEGDNVTFVNIDNNTEILEKTRS